MALSDYSQADLIAVAKSLDALREDGSLDYSKFSPQILETLIKTKAHAIANNDGRATASTGSAAQFGADVDGARGASPRDAAMAKLKSVMDGAATAQDITLTQQLLLANEYNTTLDATIDDAERSGVEQLYNDYLNQASFNAITANAATVNSNNDLKAEAAAAQAEEAAATRTAAEQQIVAAKAGLVSLGYLPADTVLDASWNKAANDALYRMQGDNAFSLQDPDGDAAANYGSLRGQQEAIFGTSYGPDASKWQIQNSEALATVVGQVALAAHPDLRDDLVSGDPQKIKVAQGVLALTHDDVKVTGAIDTETALRANEYGAAGFDGVPQYLLNGRGRQFDNAQIDRAAEKDNLPIVTEGLDEARLAAFNALGGADTLDGRKFYADIIKQEGVGFYEDLLENAKIPVPVPTPEQAERMEVIDEMAVDRQEEFTNEQGLGNGLDVQLAALTQDDLNNLPENVREPILMLHGHYRKWQEAETLAKEATDNNDHDGAVHYQAEASSASLAYADDVYAYTETGEIDAVKAFLESKKPAAEPEPAVEPEGETLEGTPVASAEIVIDHQAEAPESMQADASGKTPEKDLKLGSTFAQSVEGVPDAAVVADATLGQTVPGIQHYRR